MTKTGRKILVGVDEGDESTYALSWCIRNMICDEHNTNDTLILLHAKPPRTVFTHMDSSIGYLFPFDTIATMERYSNEVAQGLLEKAKQLCQDLNDQIMVEMILKRGDPKDVICEVAEKLNVDILVMGSHGYGVIKRTILGSVSNHCAQNVRCPVLIVKKPKSNCASHKFHD